MHRLYYYGNKFGPSPPPSRPQSAMTQSDTLKYDDNDIGIRRPITPILSRKPKRILKSATSRGSARRSRKISANSSNEDEHFTVGNSVKKSVHYEDNTDEEINETFVHGQLEFIPKPVGRNKSEDLGTEKTEEMNHYHPVSKYLVVEQETKPSEVWKHMIRIWNLPRPNLVLSIIGGGKNFRIGPHLKERLTRILTKTTSLAKVTWIFSGGLNYGIMEIIGQIVMAQQISNKQSKIVAIGIAQLHHVIGRKRSEDAIKTEATLGYYYCENDGSKIKEDGGTLDHNHSHFILVMDSSSNSSTADVVFRPAFENYIASQGRNIVPVIQMLVEGGGMAIEHLAKSISNEIPVIVFDGTQRVANLVADSHRKHIEDKTALRIHIGDVVRNQKYELNLNKTKVALHTDQLEAIMSKKKAHLRVIYDIFTSDSDSYLEECLLKAQILAYESSAKSEEIQIKSQLSLSLTFDRPDIAREILIKYSQRIKALNHTAGELMYTALIHNKYKFVEVLVNNGFNLGRFLDTRTLWKLYSQILLLEGDSQIDFLNQTLAYFKSPSALRKDKGKLLWFIGQMIEGLVKDGNMNPYLRKFYFLETDDFCSCPDERMCTCSPRNNIYKKMHSEIPDITPEKHLFLLSVLCNRKEMAFIFWKLIPDGIAFALVASLLLKELSHGAKTSGNPILRQDLCANSAIFEGFAIAILSEAYQRKKDLAFKLLKRGLNLYGREETTVFFLADSCEMRDFMTHMCSQNMLDELWKGTMKLDTSNIKILLSLFLPVLIWFIDFNVEIEESGISICGSVSGEDSKFNGKLNNETPKHNQNGNIDNESITKSENEETAKETGGVFCCCHTNVLHKVWTISRFIWEFYTAPVTIFWWNVIAYLILLVLFSFLVLTDLAPTSPTQAEIVVYLWVITMVLEKLRQAMFSPKFRTWITRFWNIFDIIMYTCFVLSVILRFTINEERFDGARIIFSLTLCLFIVRIFEEFYISRTVGAKVILVGRMLIKLLPYLLIFAVFLIGVGVIYSANLYPNSPMDRQLLRQIIYHPYFQIFGEFFIDEMEGDEPSVCTNNATVWESGQMSRCPKQNAIVIIITAVYLLVTNVLVIHLIIAMFSTKYKTEHEKSEKIWKYQRFALVYEYCDRPILPPPLIIICHIYRIVIFLWNICRRKHHVHTYDKTGQGEAEILTIFERECKSYFVEKMKSEEHGSNAINFSVERKSDNDANEALRSIRKSLQNQDEILRKTYEKITTGDDKKKNEMQF